MITAAVIVAGAMPAAIAQSTSDTQGVPYTITFDGTVYPASLGEMEYPFEAASTGRSGSCALTVHATDDDMIEAIEIVSCTDHRFRWAAERFIDAQAEPDAGAAPITAHPLTVSWTIETNQPSVFAARND